MVALTILATTFALAFQTMGAARRLAATGLEARRAGVLLQTLLETDPGTIGRRAGQTGGFDWMVEVALAPADRSAPSLHLCRRAATAVSQSAHRRYALATSEFCRLPDQGA